jgi:hypothetical protein
MSFTVLSLVSAPTVLSAVAAFVDSIIVWKFLGPGFSVLVFIELPPFPRAVWKLHACVRVGAKLGLASRVTVQYCMRVPPCRG